MTTGAGGACLLAVSLMASQATKPFMHTRRSSINTRARLQTGQGCVALVAESLPAIGTDPDRPVTIAHLRQGQTPDGHGAEFPPVEKREGWTGRLLARARANRLDRRTSHRGPLAVNQVTGQARNGWLVGEPRITKLPRPGGVNRRHQVADSAFKVHPMTAQAIVHQAQPPIVALVKKYLCVRHGVGSRRPIRIFLLMTFPAALAHL